MIGIEFRRKLCATLVFEFAGCFLVAILRPLGRCEKFAPGNKTFKVQPCTKLNYQPQGQKGELATVKDLNNDISSFHPS